MNIKIRNIFVFLGFFPLLFKLLASFSSLHHIELICFTHVADYLNTILGMWNFFELAIKQPHIRGWDAVFRENTCAIKWFKFSLSTKVLIKVQYHFTIFLIYNHFWSSNNYCFYCLTKCWDINLLVMFMCYSYFSPWTLGAVLDGTEFIKLSNPGQKTHN